MSEYINSHQDMGPLRCEWQPAAVDRALSILPQLIYHPLHAHTDARTHVDNRVCRMKSKYAVERIIAHTEEDLH